MESLARPSDLTIMENFREIIIRNKKYTKRGGGPTKNEICT